MRYIRTQIDDKYAARAHYLSVLLGLPLAQVYALLVGLVFETFDDRALAFALRDVTVGVDAAVEGSDQSEDEGS